METKEKKIAIILNPSAGRGKALKSEKEILKCFRERKIPIYIEHSNKPLHAISIARRLSNEFTIVIAVGGDGTANEVAHGLLGSTSSMAYLPIGSGNDFNKITCISKEIPKAVDEIISGKKKKIDVGRVTIKNKDQKEIKSYFINTLGMGIDATIAKEAKQIKYIRGLGLYLTATIKALSYYKPTKFSIKIDDLTFVNDSFLFCVGNGKFEGGGFKMVPNAEPDDGHFNVCLIKKMPIKNALTVIPMVIKGSHGTHKEVIMSEARSIELKANEPFVVHADGEILEDEAIQIKIEMAKEKLSIITS